jgi:WD40 repeat protein
VAGVILLGPEQNERHVLPQFQASSEAPYESISFSVEGKWLAATAWSEDDTKVWDVKTREIVKTLPAKEVVNSAFSPDGRWLVTCGNEDYRFLEVGSWLPRRSFSRIRAGSSVGPVVLIRAGELMAVSAGEFGVELLEAATSKVLAVLDQSEQLPVCFSSNGEQLVTIDSTGVNRLWDLRLIRRQLAAMNLDWDSPSLPVRSSEQKPPPLTVTILEATNHP